MGLPHHAVYSQMLCAGSEQDLLLGMGSSCSSTEAEEISRLTVLGLPPVTSLEALAVVTGFNPGFLWSLQNRPDRQYRVFSIPKGKSFRQIEAPRVGLKFIQKWLSIHFEHKWKAHPAVHGFVKGRSHITAARVHLNARWVISVDLENFFPSTKIDTVEEALRKLGYKTDTSISILSSLLCFKRRLSQGAPTSPVISNIALSDIDDKISSIAQKCGARYTRYADDIVLSGTSNLPENIGLSIKNVFEETCWRLSERKTSMVQLPQRLKVHGLLVHGEKIRLTKGYRNKLRAFNHLLERDAVKADDVQKFKGHVNYSRQIERV
jgi:RNA-directed DNA polymerase